MSTGERPAGDPTPRWRYRFDNFSRAFRLLREGVELMEQREVSQLEKEGLIHRFEYTWELAWKVLADFLSHQGVVLPTATPRSVLRSAIEAGVIGDGEAWMQALDARNRMSHTYSLRSFEHVLAEIRSSYLAMLDRLHMSMLERMQDDVARDG